MFESTMLIFSISIFAGILSGLWGLLLDFLMDYGHIFGRIRRKKAVKILFNNGEKELLEELQEIDLNKDSWSNKLNRSVDLYDNIAGMYPEFRFWFCPYCISLRISIIAIPISGTISEFFLQFRPEDLILLIVINIIVIPTICFLTVKKLSE